MRGALMKPRLVRKRTSRFRLRDWLRRIPMAALAVIIGGVCGLGVWVVVDRFQTQAIRDVFNKDVGRRLDRWAVANLIAFNNYSESYTSVTRLLASHRRMAAYLEPTVWLEEEPVEPRVYTDSPPAWLPQAARWDQVVQPSHLLLMDTAGRAREIYQLRDLALPSELLHMDEVLLGETQVQALLTAFDGHPFLVVSDKVEDYSGTVVGLLTMVVPIDDTFLRATQSGYAGSDTVTAVLSEDLTRVLATSHPHSLPVGTSMSEARRRFVVTTQSFFDYEGSFLNMQFGIFVPKARIAEMTERVLSLERRQRMILALVMVAVFTLVIFLVSQHISRVLRRIARFSQRALGIGQAVTPRGNQLILLEDWIRDFIRMVLAARNQMRARHESELRDTHALRSSILEASPDSIITVEAWGRIIELNPTAERIFGYRRKEAVGEDMAELLIEPSRRDHFRALMEQGLSQVNESASELRAETVALRRDGSELPVELAIKSILLESQPVLTVYLHDVSSRKSAEREIQRLAKFTSESPSPVLRVSRRGALLYANAASEPLLVHWDIRRGQTLPVYWKTRVAQTLEEGRTAEHEVVCEQRIYSLLMAPIEGLDYVNIYGRDITEVRMAEQQTRQHQADLVHVCRLSTMGEMATGLAHELNQPLSAIVNFSNGCIRRLKLGTGDKDELLEVLGQVSVQADRAGEIIRRLRNLVAKQPSQRRPVEVNEMVREVCSFVEFEARKMGLTCEQEYASGPLIVRADLVQIEQVLLNLVRNALDALRQIPEDRRRLLLRTTRLDDDYAVIMVEDSGPGIEEDTRRRLFDPFFTTKDSGMGMGLAISQTIVVEHKGQLHVESQPGKGSVFSVRLPLHEEPSESVERQ
jgi:two-component system sensor kinase FixL